MWLVSRYKRYKKKPPQSIPVTDPRANVSVENIFASPIDFPVEQIGLMEEYELNFQDEELKEEKTPVFERESFASEPSMMTDSSGYAWTDSNLDVTHDSFVDAQSDSLVSWEAETNVTLSSVRDSIHHEEIIRNPTPELQDEKKEKIHEHRTLQILRGELDIISSMPSRKSHTGVILKDFRVSVPQLFYEQNSRCAFCDTMLDSQEDDHLCHYAGLLCCENCFSSGSLSIIPARILSSFDFQEYPVCDHAKAYLESMYKVPSIPLSSLAPVLLSTRSVQKLGGYFRQLRYLEKCIRDCPTRNLLLQIFGSRHYFLNCYEADKTLVKATGSMSQERDRVFGLISLRDMVDLVHDRLNPKIKRAIAKLDRHTTTGRCSECFRLRKEVKRSSKMKKR